MYYVLPSSMPKLKYAFKRNEGYFLKTAMYGTVHSCSNSVHFPF
jgi:hypothetical protein